MDEMGDVELRRERSNPYPPPPPNPIHRMPPAETSLHSYHHPPPPPPPPGSAMPPPAPAWNPTPSPYNDNADHRPPPPPPVDIPHQAPPYPAPSQPYPPPPPPPPSAPPGRETPGYPPDPGAYGRPGSVSGPSRSPADVHQPHYQSPQYHPVSSQPHEPPYYPPTPGDYRTRHAYPGPETQANGSHQSPHHVVTGHEMMPAQPVVPPPQYGPASAGPPPPPPAAYYYDYASQRRKPVRAAQACDSCRQRKAKCDEGRPECQHCKDNGLKCSYREIPPQKSEKQALAMTSQLESLTEAMNKILQISEAQAEEIRFLRTVIVEIRAAQVGGSAPKTPEEKPHIARSEQPPVPKESTSQSHGRDPSTETTSAPRAPSQQPKPDPKTLHSNAEVDAMDFSMPPKHTTAAQNLLSWPSIKALVPKNIQSSFVTEEENERLLLLLYGAGEGNGIVEVRETAPSPADSFSSDERRLDGEVSLSPYGVWGSGHMSQPQASTQSHSAHDHPGGLMLDSEAVDRYFKSYLDNIHILHPILEPKTIRAMIQSFKQKYSWPYGTRQSTVAPVGTKRKRENTGSPSPMEGFNAQNNIGVCVPARRAIPPESPPIAHSIGNAIVLLVMALGKVTAHRSPLPGPAPTGSIRTTTPYYNTLYSDLPGPPMPMSAPASPYDHQVGLNGMNSGRMPHVANTRLRNMDVIPGLAYYARATVILSEFEGGHNIEHVQAYLLAGLYMGQLARINQSYSYINRACVATQILIESAPYVEGTMDPKCRNLVNFAFWSCLQLESDIAAEMQLPLSGITRYESTHYKELPGIITLDPIPETSGENDMLRYYSYQIQLRLTMNSIHSTLYRASKDPQSKPSSTIMAILDENLEDWRGMLNDWGWDDDDHESPNINVARMRGKYYGAKYIIWRPAVQYALQQAEAAHRERPSESPAGGGSGGELASPAGSQRTGTGWSINDSSPEMEELLRGAKTCIQAAMRSTTVFDKVPRRLVVTNIFGTAHAQFGNMLVLYATYTSPDPRLSSLVDEATLKRLHCRTIDILRENENISPSLAKDLKILEHVRRKVFPSANRKSHAAPSTSSSFSSR